MLNNNQTTAANKGKIKDQSTLEYIFGFCKAFERLVKKHGFHLTFRTDNLQDIIYTSIAYAVKIDVTMNSLRLYESFLIPSTDTQGIFNESIQNRQRIMSEEWYTERRLVTDQTYQFNIGSSRLQIFPKYLICAHQSENRSGLPNKRNSFFLIILTILM